MSKPTLIITNTDQLSGIADAIIARAGNPDLTKNSVLNLIAAGIAGPKHNWGFVKSQTSPLTGIGVIAAQIAEQNSEEVFSLTPDGMRVKLHFPALPGREERVVEISNWQILLIEEKLFGDASDKHTFIDNQVKIQIFGDVVLVCAGSGDDYCCAKMPIDTFREMLGNSRKEITTRVLASDPGSAIHDAFIAVAEGQVDLDQYEQDTESAKAFSMRVDAACIEATLKYIAAGAQDIHRHILLRDGRPYDIVNDIIDHNWTIMTDILETTGS